MGPRAIREASHMMCDGIHPHFDVSPAERLTDVGDLALPNTSLERMREALAAPVAELIRRTTWPGWAATIPSPCPCCAPTGLARATAGR
jgi:agmatinase